MRNIYTCVDIGSDSIRYATMEYYNGKFNVLASTIVPSMGVRKGKIYDANLVCNALKKGFKNIENTLGTKIEQAIAIIPSDNMEFDIVSSEIENDSENKRISGNLIFKRPCR